MRRKGQNRDVNATASGRKQDPAILDDIKIARDAFYGGKKAEGERILKDTGAKVALCLRQTNKSPEVKQSLYKIYGTRLQPRFNLNPEESLPSTDMVIVSASSRHNSRQTFIFPAQGDQGDFSTITEIDGSQRGTLSHKKALEDAGIDFVIPCEGVPLSGVSKRVYSPIERRARQKRRQRVRR